jgi:PadR family transcriptional regulator AphA
MSNGKLTPTSYVVLGLVSLLGMATPYDLKRMVGWSIGNFWSFPHSQLYAEPTRLAAMGLLEERQESGGRRRRQYTVTDEGRKVFEEWLADAQGEAPELRDAGTLKLFFGNFASPEDVHRLAESQVRMHREKLEAFQALMAQFGGVTGLDYQFLTLRLGIAVQEACASFWEEVRDHPPGASAGRDAQGGV